MKNKKNACFEMALKIYFHSKKNNIWCNAMCFMRFKVKKKNIIFHILYIIVAPLCSTFLKRVIFTKLIDLRCEVCSDWPAIQCVVIGRIPQACDKMLHPASYSDADSRRNDTKSNKIHYK